jgi:hypothetical protein
MGSKLAALVLLLLAVLHIVPQGAAAAAAAANAISCYTSVPRAPGQRPAATPVAYPRKDGYSACLRYQYRCVCSARQQRWQQQGQQQRGQQQGQQHNELIGCAEITMHKEDF